MSGPHQLYDLLVVGGGINGAGIARDAAGRGLSVLLVEQGDLAGATSSASSKLIHGGLRYLEQFELGLVRASLAEREVLLSLAPHIIRPLTFILPHDKTLRPAWMLRAGLFLYDHLAPRSRLAGSRSVDLRTGSEGAPLKPGFTRGFSYADCWVEDSRLVVLNAMDAAERGASIHTRCRFLGAQRDGSLWRATLKDDGLARHVSARAIVNAAGPWVGEVLGRLGRKRPADLRLVKGSHIVVPRLYEGEHAYLLQNEDRRIVFVIPFEERFTLIGTTDIAFDGDPAMAAITPEETAYLCAAVARVFARPPRSEDVVWSYAGVRPLQDEDERDPSKLSRDYVLELEGGADVPPLLSVIGGKITTYRRLAEQALAKLAAPLAFTAGPWTAGAPLPGGDLGEAGVDGLVGQLCASRPWLPLELARRLARSYGTRAVALLGGARSLGDLGQDLGAGLTEQEVRYLIEHEWATTADDILWRRSKLGLHGGAALLESLEAWLAAEHVR